MKSNDTTDPRVDNLSPQNLETTPPSNLSLRKTVSFTQSDLDRIEELKSALESSSNAQTLSMAIKLAADIVRQQQNGGKIIFDNDGDIREIMIAGLTKNKGSIF